MIRRIKSIHGMYRVYRRAKRDFYHAYGIKIDIVPRYTKETTHMSFRKLAKLRKFYKYMIITLMIEKMERNLLEQVEKGGEA